MPFSVISISSRFRTLQAFLARGRGCLQIVSTMATRAGRKRKSQPGPQLPQTGRGKQNAPAVIGGRAQPQEPMAETNPYELAVLERVARRQLKAKELGLRELATSVVAAFHKDKAIRAQNRKPRAPRQPIEPTRKSGRCIGRPSNYFEQDIEVDRASRQASRKKRPRTIPEDACEPASAAAQAAALKAASAYAEDKSGYVKQMSYSQVRKGYWCSIPSAMLGAYPNSKEKHTFEMCCEEDAPEEGFAEESKAKTWKVVWLPRQDTSGKSGKICRCLGTGFSGGWRGFAIDHQLTSNDLVVFCVLKPAGKPACVDATIFRTKDYERA